jgi:hypothetical protein
MHNFIRRSRTLNGFRWGWLPAALFSGVSLYGRLWCGVVWCGVVLLGMLTACLALADIDKSQAADIAQRTYGGKLFGKIEMVRLSDERVVYEVRLDDKGHMIIVHVDLQGKIVKTQ